MAGKRLTARIKIRGYTTIPVSAGDPSDIIGNSIEANAGTSCAVVAVPYTASWTPDPLAGEVHCFGPMTGDVTINEPANAYSGQKLTILFIQDGTGGRYLTFDGPYQLGGWGPNTDPGSVSVISFVFYSSAWVRVAAGSGELYATGGTAAGALRFKDVVLTDAATIVMDSSDGNNFEVTLGGNRTLGTPLGAPSAGEGQDIRLLVKQDATGGRTLAFSSDFVFSADLPEPDLSTAPNAVDMLAFRYRSAAGKWMLTAMNKGFGDV